VADVVIRPVDRLPPLGTTSPVQDLRIVSGGCAANTACVLAKLAVPTAVAGLIGQDLFGEAVLTDLQAAGVDISALLRRPDAQTSAVIVVVNSDGERSFLYRQGGNEAMANGMISDGCLAQARFVHVGGAMKLLSLNLCELLQKARAGGCVTSLDTDWDTRGSWMRQLAPALPHVDYLLTNEEEGAMLTGCRGADSIADHLLSLGPRVVIVKCGHRGAFLASRDVQKQIAPFRVNVVDTTCAGDGFAGGFLCGLRRGWDVEKATRFANAVGALCTTEISHWGVVSFQKTQEFMESQS
jgi:sugar/nucleoside kinase (ribokinase family)